MKIGTLRAVKQRMEEGEELAIECFSKDLCNNLEK